jgi:hypothetical protein
MSYEEQATAYLRYAKIYQLPAIYVASGNASSIAIFMKAVSPLPVVTKSTLLSGEELSLLKSLSWDQQAQVDFLVLLRASQFLGMTDSNFSWAVAVARRTEARDGTCGTWRAEGQDEAAPEPGLALRDEFSIIVGAPSKYHFRVRSWP